VNLFHYILVRRGEGRMMGIQPDRTLDDQDPIHHMIDVEICTSITFLASQRKEARKSDKVSEITCSICQSKTLIGLCKVKITIEEYPSRMNFQGVRKLSGNQPRWLLKLHHMWDYKEA
jgi:hypothetical protein